MKIKGINILTEAFNVNNGKDATISISHKLYGGQKIKCKLDGFCDGNRIGFKVCNGQDIFIYSDDLANYGVDNGIYFADDMMEITIKLQEQ